jgi:hypothetical protein
MVQLTLENLIAKRPKGQRVWVVRASGGYFTETFRSASLMAIGHVDKLDWRKGPVSASALERLPHDLADAFPKRARMSITSHANQTKRFCTEVNEGDMVVTLDSGHLMVGTVAGSPYIGKAPVIVEHAFRQSIKMPYHLRRPVHWGPIIPRSSVPVSLEMTLQAHQTVFSLDHHWEAVYHLLYPCFASDGILYLSTNIRQRKSLSNYRLSQFFAVLSGIEAVAKTLGTDGLQSSEGYLHLFSAFVAAHQLTLTSKAEFMSPGTIWSKVKMTPKQMAVCAMLYVMLFGGDMTVLKTDGIIDKELRHQIFEIAKDLVLTHEFKKLEQDLKLEIPKLDTRPIDGREPIPTVIA